MPGASSREASAESCVSEGQAEVGPEVVSPLRGGGEERRLARGERVVLRFAVAVGLTFSTTLWTCRASARHQLAWCKCRFLRL